MTESKPSRPQPTTTIQSLAHDGRGVTQINGKTAFIRHALPHETVSFVYTKKHRKFNEGLALGEIQNPNPHRVAPKCQHFGRCGGCNLQHLSNEQQILHKQQTLLDHLAHFGRIQPENILPPLIGPTWGYRRKARLGCKYVLKKEKVLVGFREIDGRFLADLAYCEVLDSRFAKLITPMSQWIGELSIRDKIPQVELAGGDDDIALVLRHLSPFSSKDIERLRAFAEKWQLKLYLQPGNESTCQLFYPEGEQERLSYAFPDYDLNLHFHPLDFTQVNPEINRAMLQKALELLAPEPEDNILDLFCGLGNFTLPLAQHCAHITGVEGSTTMVDRAKENSRLNNLNNTAFYCADLSKDITQLPFAKQRYDKILLDPARTGALDIIKQFTDFNAKRIVYVSCNPATLARDAGELVTEQGYRLVSVGVMDMFPHTGHVESIALFEK